MNKLKESTIKIIKRTIGSFFLVGLILSLISYLSVSQGNTFAFGNIVAIIFICAILGIPTYFLLYKDLKEKNVASIDEYLQKIEDLKNQIKELFIKNNKLTTTNSTLTKRVYALASEDMQSKGNVNDTSTDPLNNYIELSSQNSTNVEEILPNSQIHRTSKDESLSLSFFTNHEKIIYDYENKLLKSIEIYTLEEDIDKQIELCKNAISIFKRFRDFCYRTKGGTIYFQDTWEYYYNSHNGYSSYIDSTIKRLKYLQDNYNMLKNMKQIIIDTIKNNSGILQKNIYALIDINFKNEIQYAIRQLEDEQIIKDY